MVEREPSGRPKRSSAPDRGTPEVQAKRQALTGKPHAPLDIADPIDVLYRGDPQVLSEGQARAAAMWRSATRKLLAGEGPRLAMQREPTGPGRGSSARQIRQARRELTKIQEALGSCRPQDIDTTRNAVMHQVFPDDTTALVVVLERVAWALGLR